MVPDFFGAGVRFPLLGEEHFEFALGQGMGGVADLLDEVGDVVTLGDHLVGGVVVGPVRVAEPRGDLVTRFQQAGEDFVILGVGAREGGGGDAAAQGLAFGEAEDGQGVGIIGGDLDLAVSTGLVTVDVILGQAVEFGGIGFDHVLSVGNIAIEHGLFFGGLVVQLLEAGAGGVVFIYAGEAEFEKLALDVVLCGGVGF